MQRVKGARLEGQLPGHIRSADGVMWAQVGNYGRTRNDRSYPARYDYVFWLKDGARFCGVGDDLAEAWSNAVKVS